MLTLTQTHFLFAPKTIVSVGPVYFPGTINISFTFLPRSACRFKSSISFDCLTIAFVFSHYEKYTTSPLFGILRSANTSCNSARELLLRTPRVHWRHKHRPWKSHRSRPLLSLETEFSCSHLCNSFLAIYFSLESNRLEFAFGNCRSSAALSDLEV